MSALANAGDQRNLLLYVLLNCLWGLTIDQLPRLIPCSLSTVRRLVAQLKREGLVQRVTICHHPEIIPTGPLARLQRGERQAENILRRVAREAKARWLLPHVISTAITARKKAADFYGGLPGRIPRPSETTHNVHISSCFLVYKERHPALIASWVDERTILKERQQGEKSAPLPDARCVLPDGTVRYVEQCGKSYRFEHLMPLWVWVEAQGGQLELW